MSKISSTFLTASNKLKPHRAEALQRIRLNTACLITTLVVSYLLPLPSIPAALKILFTASQHATWTTEWLWERVCFLEMALVFLWLYNIVEGIYAIKYPRAPLPAITSPAKLKAPTSSWTKTPSKRPFKVLSPNTSPQPQRSFASPAASLTSVSMALHSLSSTTTPRKSGYPPSPVSTPSRVLHYTAPPSSSTNTLGSSTASEYLSTPSPVVSAYRGKQLNSGIEVGRALDGSYLSRLKLELEDDDD